MREVQEEHPEEDQHPHQSRQEVHQATHATRHQGPRSEHQQEARIQAGEIIIVIISLSSLTVRIQ